MEKSGPKHWFRRNRNKNEEQVEEEIKSIVTEGHESGVIQQNEAEMISNIFEFGDKEAKDVMTPRQQVEAIDRDTPLREAMDVMLEHGYSRYPMYQGDLDNIVGVIHLKDAMRFYLKDNDAPLTDIARKAHFVHPTQSINELFNEMQTQKIHMTIVVDEYGQTEGIVAMEDILEVIVGDILDEYDEEEKSVIELADGVGFLIKGSARLEELQSLLDIPFPDEDIDTLNGLLLYLLGHLPKEGEKIRIDYEGYCFEAIDIHEKMIRQVRCTPKPKESAETQADGEKEGSHN